MRHPAGSFCKATVNVDPDCVTCLPCTLNGRGNNYISAIPADIYVSRLFESNVIACGALSLACSQDVSVPILAGRRALPDVWGHPIKYRC